MKNLGIIDRIIRILLVGVIFYAYYIGWITSWVAILSAFVAAMLLVTALTADCPVYKWLGISTVKRIKTS